MESMQDRLMNLLMLLLFAHFVTQKYLEKTSVALQYHQSHLSKIQHQFSPSITNPPVSTYLKVNKQDEENKQHKVN